MHLLDALGRSDQIETVPMHHEQAAAIAADAYGRVHNTIGIALVTSGPGGTNAVTGVAGAWLESTPLLVISGQVSKATWKQGTDVRQMGFQEIDIIPIIKSITKYSALVSEPETIRYHVEKAAFVARSGRPGPVWLDIPLDVQAATIDDERLIGFNAKEMPSISESADLTDDKINTLIQWLEESERPLLLGGHGVWLSNAKEAFRRLVDTLAIPVQTSWNGIDLIEESHPLFFGRPNSYGPRYPNFIIQNCDLLISIGCRLGIQQIGYNYAAFSRGSKKVVVDIDSSELHKKTIRTDLAIQTDAKYFLDRFLGRLEGCGWHQPNIEKWIAWCNERKMKYPVCADDYFVNDGYVDPYVFFDNLSDVLHDGALIIPGSSGTGFTVSNQVFKIKKNQRFFTSKGLAAMGYGLPSAIGGCFAVGKRDVITVIGDGGFQLNIQELQTVVHNNLPIKIFVFNNQGYLSIRATQSAYFDGLFVGSGMSSGVGLPDLHRVAYAYGIPYVRLKDMTNLRDQISQIVETKGCVLCEVMLNPRKAPLPKLSSRKMPDGSIVSRPLEDLEPLLARDELQSNMLVDLLWKKE